jgi:ABC-2 type transport system permease protein
LAQRTLPVRVEIVRQLRRRRTIAMFGLVFALPLVILGAFRIGGQIGRNSGQVSFLNLSTTSGLNFTATCLFLSAGFFMTVPVALCFGDAIASEASWSSLRYLLAAPVPRARLLRAKLLTALLFSTVATVLVAVTALIAGIAVYGAGALQLPVGGALGIGQAVPRIGMAVLYILVTQLATASLAFWLSTVTDAPLGAVGGALGLTIIGNILGSISALGGVRDFLPTFWTYSWVDALQPQIAWDGMIKGAAVAVSYSLVLFALAFRHFRDKDVVS